MGMAASQARYLGLAARKTNCEYQGQQINQARTALGNQSAELWNQMLGLSVPTAPNTTDYTKTQYSFSDGQNDYEITSMIPTDEEDGYNYSVKYKYYEQEVKGIENINTNPQVQYSAVATTKLENQTLTYNATLADPKFEFAGTQLSELTGDELKIAKAELKKSGVTFADTDKIYSAGKGNYYVGATPTGTADLNNATIYNNIKPSYKVGNSTASKVDLTDVEVKTSLDKIAEDNPNTVIAEAIKNGEPIYTYQKNGTTYYASQAEMDAAIVSTKATAADTASPIDKQNSMKQYYTATIKTEKINSDYALMDDASGTGRFTSIKLQDYNTAFDLNTETTTNETEYQNALNQYYYDTQQYEKTLADINAKTELIQNEDRTLELRLKQLDTEHNALQTEMEAVKKVITKNVEDTFKTFGG